MMKLPNRPFRFLAIELVAISAIFAIAAVVRTDTRDLLVALIFVHAALGCLWMDWRKPSSAERNALFTATRHPEV